MKKLIMRSVMALAVFAGLSLPAKAQMQPQPLPVDSAVVTGVLDNGLTYYIRHNELPKGQADFYIAQKVGSILEDENHQLAREQGCEVRREPQCLYLDR